MDETAVAPTGIALGLFDSFRLEVGGAEVDLAEGPQRLVALLALRGRLTRCRAAGTLWPDAPPQRAMARLRTQIWRVHQVVTDLVASDGRWLALHPDVETDVRRLTRLAGAALAGPEADLGAWSPQPHSGELLPEWDDEWLDDDRERLRQLRLHTLEAVAVRLAGAGRFGPAVDLALTVLRADPLRESAHRVLIRVHLTEGNLVEARRAYRRCALLLEGELGVAPSRATTVLLPDLGLTPGQTPRQTAASGAAGSASRDIPCRLGGPPASPCGGRRPDVSAGGAGRRGRR